MADRHRIKTIPPQNSEKSSLEEAALKRPDLKLGDELHELVQALGLSEAECAILEQVREAAEPIKFD